MVNKKFSKSKKPSIQSKDEEIKRLLRTLNYTDIVKEKILDSLRENPNDFSLREEILKLFKIKISEENSTQGKRNYRKQKRRKF